MRSQLLVGGLLVAGLGWLFFLTEVPLFYFWSVPFVAGGALMAAVSPFLEERSGPVPPPPGKKFCVFCSEVLDEKATTCPRCAGVQPGVS